MADFELAFMAAVKKVFPDYDVKGCLFHYSQCILRKIQNSGFINLYKYDGDYALHLKMFYALAYVPVNHVITVYESLIKLPFFVDREEKLSEFLDYMESNWIGKLTRRGERQRSTYDVVIWNHYQSTIDEVERTNNSIEGWHNRFNMRVQNAHVTIWQFIEFLRNKQGLTEYELEQMVGGKEPSKKKRKYRNHDRRLLNVVETWGKVDNLEYLRGIAHNIEY
ncbi:uncharacterized protein LOC123273681 [Cotesia glomerata]|uniref:uncharacterized protein LOC123273681 n=1 Tax=Cotesia glomerata TaxID=32391 RepID=UPI001D01E6F7|nr:uncharacterized protein LOC123273681 [Cotesia glomerata]